MIESDVTLELNSDAWPVFPIAARAITYPFTYSQEERTDLGALLSCQYPDPMGRLSAWAASFVRSNPTDTLALLKDLNAGISANASYQEREDEGTQSPTRTLDLGRGSCRDFAVLFVEAARTLGFGARMFPAIIFAPALQGQAGTTHAWAEVFVPGAGWITFDPTNRQTWRLQPDPRGGGAQPVPGHAGQRQLYGSRRRPVAADRGRDRHPNA